MIKRISAFVKKHLNLLTTIVISICALLVLSMILLAGTYMVNNQQNRLESSESVPENILYELKYGSNFVSQNFNFNYLLPEFVGMKINDEKMVGSATGEDAIRFILVYKKRKNLMNVFYY